MKSGRQITPLKHALAAALMLAASATIAAAQGHDNHGVNDISPNHKPTAQENALVKAVREATDRFKHVTSVAGGGRIGLAARNAAEVNRTLHAELNLVQGWVASTGAGLPAGWRIVTSLQPCRMCAAMLVRAAEGPVRVEYLVADPGRLATRTALQAVGWEFPVPER